MDAMEILASERLADMMTSPPCLTQKHVLILEIGSLKDIVCLCSSIYLPWTCKNLVLFSAMKCKFIIIKRWSISLFMTFTKRNWELVPMKQTLERKTKRIFTCFETNTSASFYLLCLVINFFIRELFQTARLSIYSSHAWVKPKTLKNALKIDKEQRMNTGHWMDHMDGLNLMTRSVGRK